MKRKAKKEDELLKIATEFCLICPNCDRTMPNVEFRLLHGCRWCIHEHQTKDSNGKY